VLCESHEPHDCVLQLEEQLSELDKKITALERDVNKRGKVDGPAAETRTISISIEVRRLASALSSPVLRG
jgi:hypothetical protein